MPDLFRENITCFNTKNKMQKLSLHVGSCISTCVHAKLLQLSSVQLLSHVRLFVIPWTAARQASLSITNSQNLFKLMSIELVMPSNHLILCHPLLFPPSLLQLSPTLCDPMERAPLFIGFCRQEYCSGLPCPPQGDLLDPGVEPMSPALQADSFPTEPRGKPLYPHITVQQYRVCFPLRGSNYAVMSKLRKYLFCYLFPKLKNMYWFVEGKLTSIHFNGYDY